MTRKSKQAGGHNPLTYYERNKKFASSQYGTTTQRLSSDSQLKFGDCALSLSAAVDPVATPSGHIYSREAIVSYMVEKTKDIQKAKANYQAFVTKQRQDDVKRSADAQSQAIVAFEGKQRATAITEIVGKKRRRRQEADDDDVNVDAANSSNGSGSNPLARVSYWLSEFQPECKDEGPPPPPPDRPLSPFSGQPLRLKDLQSLKLERSSSKDGNGNNEGGGKVLCAISHKTITTQPVVALNEYVVLESVYNDLKIGDTMTCPITGRKLKRKQIRTLQKGQSGFASSGTVVAKKYRPTIT